MKPTPAPAGDPANMVQNSPGPCVRSIGVNFRTAPVAVRESLSFTPEATREFLSQFAADHQDLELLLLSTCNRTEFYLAEPNGTNSVDRLLGALTEFRPDAHILHSECHRYQLENEDAVKHLMRVACGLDSAILGDQQILGQIKSAKSVAGESGTLGLQLENLLQHTIRAAKRSRSETHIGRGAASIGAAIRETLAGRKQDNARVLVIGAGDTARDIGRHVAKNSSHQITFLNRTRERAQVLAEDCGGQAVAWSDISSHLAQSDFVITATSCPHPIITRTLFAGLPVHCHPQLLIDVGVPRNIAPGLPVETINIDAIHDQQEAALQIRRGAVPQVENIIRTEMANWQCWLKRRPVEILVKQLFLDALAPFVSLDTPLNRDTRRMLPADARRNLGIRARQLRACIPA